MAGRKTICDLIVVKEDRIKFLDVNAFRGAAGRGISDYHLVVAKIRCLRRMKRMEEGKGERISY